VFHSIDNHHPPSIFNRLKAINTNFCKGLPVEPVGQFARNGDSIAIVLCHPHAPYLYRLSTIDISCRLYAIALLSLLGPGPPYTVHHYPTVPLLNATNMRGHFTTQITDKSGNQYVRTLLQMWRDRSRLQNHRHQGRQLHLKSQRPQQKQTGQSRPHRYHCQSLPGIR